MSKARFIKKCRACGNSHLIDIISLGKLAVSDFVQSNGISIKSTLSLVMCDDKSGGCSLIQLKHTSIDPNLLYRHYWYKSGVNQTMRLALLDVVKKAKDNVKLEKGDIVIDIGANDGTLLRDYKDKDIIKVGFEPAINLVSEAKEGGNIIINDFFNYSDFKNIIEQDKCAKIITSIAMFYDLENPNMFVSDLATALDKRGIWINQLSYLPLMISQNAFDNICHEHIEYYSLSSISKLLKNHDLEVFDVELNDVNGGSFRIYVKHKENDTIPISKNVEALLTKERQMKIDEIEIYNDFVERVENIRKTVTKFIKNNIKMGKKFYIYGASTKGNTLLQYFNLDNREIIAAADKNPDKWGKKTVVTSIPIVSEEIARDAKPDYFLVLPWHFKKEFVERETDYLKNGGKMLFPLPTPEITEYKDGKLTTSKLID